jgi:hypothetical protein
MASTRKSGPHSEMLYPTPQWNTTRQSTIQWYTHITASAVSIFTSCCIMRNQFSTLDTESKTALKRRKLTIQSYVCTLIAGQITTLCTNGTFLSTTPTSLYCGCGAFNSGSRLGKATGPPKSRRRFSYIIQRIKLWSTNATVSKCQHQSLYALASTRMREICKSMGCNPPDDRTSLPRMSVFQPTMFR